MFNFHSSVLLWFLMWYSFLSNLIFIHKYIYKLEVCVLILPFYSARYVEVERDICCDRGKDRETMLSSLQACFAIAHSSGDFLYICILFPFFSLYLLTGYYLYIETSTGIVGSKAVLVSPQYQQAYSNCKLKFSYHMYGSTVGSLAVFLNDGTSRTRMMMLIGLYSK